MTRIIIALNFVLFCNHLAFAAPDYTRSILKSIFPAGAQRGTSVAVRFRGLNNGLKGATDIVVDGPPGITVSDVKDAGKDLLQATLTIAKDAIPGRRMLRVKGGIHGLTNFRWFFVSPIHEHVEKEKNNGPQDAESVSQPVIVNGVVNPTLDQDCFTFSAKKAQNIVLAVKSHWLDANGYGRNEAGFSDTSLELLNANGQIVAEAGDVLGYDPLIEYQIPEDGNFTVRVSGMGYKGHPEMVYRLTIGELPYPTSIFPAGGVRGETVDVEINGPNVPQGTRQTIVVDDEQYPIQFVNIDGAYGGVTSVPFVREELPNATAVAQASQETLADDAIPLTLPQVINGRFDRANDDDWFTIKLDKGDSVTLDVMAQRHLRPPVDTLLEVFDKKKTLVASNDDAELYRSECTHDFIPFDSFLRFGAKKSGRYFIRISEQSGKYGPRSVYRLKAFKTQPDFRLYQWPDALPVFGGGSTSAFVVETHRLGNLKADIKLSVQGLPKGWTTSTTTVHHANYREPRGAFGHKVFVTVTAPENAQAGDSVELKVVGTCNVEGKSIERVAQPLTLYLFQEPNRFRYSPVARAVVTKSSNMAFKGLVDHIRGKPGQTLQIPIQVRQPDQANTELTVSINKAGTHFKCSVGAPLKVKLANGKASVPFNIPATWKPGPYEFVIADAWASETRKGLPGPCTQLIRLTVE